MEIPIRSTFLYSYKSLCVVVVAFMVSYWVYRFGIEDRDVGVVDLVTFEESDDVEFPIASICFTNPFLDKKLNKTDPTINSTSYMHYLKGEIYNERFESIDYENVTLNLNEHFLYGQVKYFNESEYRNTTSSKFKHHVIFNGFYYESFVKCFQVTMNKEDHRDVRGVVLYYSNETLFEELADPFEREWQYYYNVHYPHQFLLETRSPYNHRLVHTGGGMFAWVKGVEVIKRRTTRTKTCMADGKHFDELVLSKHIRRSGCRAPYHGTYKGFTICATKEDIKRSIYHFREVRKRYYPKACQRISKIDYVAQASSLKGQYEFGISYPEDVKLITQYKEVDGHALIGNIGGYIGLFLGNHYH